MRITQLETGRNLITSMENLASALNETARQMYTGKKLNNLADSPLGSADLVDINRQSMRLESYRSNIETAAYHLKSADSAMNEVYTTFSSVYTLASEAVTETTSPDSHAAIALQIKKLREEMISYANSQADGRYIFAGTAVTTKPFELNAATGEVEYSGDSTVSSIPVHDEVEMTDGVSGDIAFTKIFKTVDDMVKAFDNGDMDGVKTAMESYEDALNQLEQARGEVGTSLSLVDHLKATLDSRDLVLTEQKSIVEDANMMEAIVKLAQLQTAMSASSLSGSAILQQSSLFDTIG